MADKLVKDGTEWRAQLTPIQYAVLDALKDSKNLG
jgi:hypothetical protein